MPPNSRKPAEHTAVVDFPALLELLESGGVQFIIIGGAAATAHGSVRLTLDLDIVYERSPENIRRLVVALEPAEPYLRGAHQDCRLSSTPRR